MINYLRILFIIPMYECMCSLLLHTNKYKYNIIWYDINTLTYITIIDIQTYIHNNLYKTSTTSMDN